MQMVSLLTAASAAVSTVIMSVSAAEFDVFGYMPLSLVSSFAQMNDTFPLLSHVILHSLDVSSSGNVLVQDRLPAPDSNDWANVIGASNHHKTKLLVSIGGAGRQAGFGKAIEEDVSRAKLVDSICEFCESWSLDGVDFDISIPGEEDHQTNLVYFFESLQARLHAKQRMVTLAVHPGPLKHLASGILNHADHVHLMAYDNWCEFPPTAHPPCKHSEYEYARDVIRQFINVQHVKRDLMTLGVPLYGRHVHSGQAMSFAEIAQRHPNDLNLDEAGGYSFNGRDTIHKKIQLAFSYRLGGVMLWELGQDAPVNNPHALLPIVRKAVDDSLRMLEHGEEL